MSSSDPSASSPEQAGAQPAPPDWPAARPAGTTPFDPGLYIVSTPIGNLRDVTLRALDVLTGVDEVLAEDTRIARKLLDAYGIAARVTPYHDHNGARRRPDILRALEDGARIALISDAGTPLVSDPGFKLVREAAEAGHAIIPVPGASAMLAGLVAAGLPSDRFLFVGFLPPKAAARKKALAALARAESTLITYESGPRLAAMLADAAEVLGGARLAAVARELTKRFEDIRRGTLASLAADYAEAGAPRGEIVVLVGPPVTSAAGAGTGTGTGDLDAYLLKAMAELPLKSASEAAAAALGVPRRLAYQRALALKDKGEGRG